MFLLLRYTCKHASPKQYGFRLNTMGLTYLLVLKGKQYFLGFERGTPSTRGGRGTARAVLGRIRANHFFINAGLSVKKVSSCKNTCNASQRRKYLIDIPSGMGSEYMNIRATILGALGILGFNAMLVYGAGNVIQNKGSDTLVNVAQAWAEAYQKVRPDVSIAVSGGGSGTGIAALINGTVDIANTSRKIERIEKNQAKKNGHDPVEFIVGYDALAVFTHKQNPLDTISLEKLAGIYGENGKIVRWDQLGVKVPGCSGQEIIRVSRQNNSGTYAYFRETALNNMDYKSGSMDMHGSKDVTDLVEKTPCAIGYSGLAYANDQVKMLCISEKEGGKCVQPSETTASDKTYPIARPLFMYTSGQPTGEVKKYLDWILSDEGQCIIKKKGYSPLRQVKCQ